MVLFQFRPVCQDQLMDVNGLSSNVPVGTRSIGGITRQLSFINQGRSLFFMRLEIAKR